MSCKRLGGDCVLACLHVSSQAQQINHRYESRNRLQYIAILANCGRLHNHGLCFSGCMLPIRTRHVRGNRTSSIITSSSVRLLWRLRPQLVIFVCTLPCERSCPVSPCCRFSCQTGFPRVQPVFCPTLLPGISATCRSVYAAAASSTGRARSKSLPNLKYVPATDDGLDRTSARSQITENQSSVNNLICTTVHAEPGRRGGLGYHLRSPASSQDLQRRRRGCAVPISSPPSKVPRHCMFIAGFTIHAGRVDPATRGSYQQFLFVPLTRVWDLRYG